MRFDLGEGGVAAIASQAQILHWVEQQKAAWRTVPSESKSSSEAITDLTSRIAELGRVIHKTVTAPTSLQAGTELADSIRYIRPILVDSPAGQKIVSAMIEDRIEDLKTLLSAPTIDGGQLHRPDREQISVISDDKLAAAVRELLPSALHHLLPSGDELLKAVSDARSEIVAVSAEIASLRLAANAQMTEIATERTTAREAARERDLDWKNTLQAYNEQLRLAKTSTLWRNRAAAHKNSRRTFGIAAISSGFAALMFTGIAAKLLFANAANFTSLQGEAFAFHRIIFASAGTLLVMTLGLWAVRIIVRLYMTEHHLAIDAESREALGDTYVSLTAEGDAALDDRKIVLAALFRPISDGIVNDDAMPLISPAAMASGMLAAEKPKT